MNSTIRSRRVAEKGANYESTTFLPQEKSEQAPTQSTHSRLKSMTWMGYVAIVIGTAVLAADVAFLIFFWTTSNLVGDGRITSSPSVWRHIVQREWSARTITICTVIMRLAVALQAGVAFSMAAALAWEKSSITKSAHLPQLSLIRAFSVTPGAVVSLLGEGAFRSITLPHGLLMSAVVLTSLLLQFSSTLLLLDFGNMDVVMGRSSVADIYVGLRNHVEGRLIDTSVGADYWHSNPTVFPRFAQYAEAPESGDDFVDTGVTYRALLPFAEQEQRERLRNFTGPMTILNSRTICVRPTLHNLTFEKIQFNAWDVNGTFELPRQYPPLNFTRPGPYRFNCSMGLPEDLEKAKPMRYWPITLCTVSASVFVKPWTETGELMVRADGIIMLNTSTSSNETFLAAPSERVEQSFHGPWASYGAEAGNQNATIGLDATVCFRNGDPSYAYNVSIWSDGNGREPRIGWNRLTGLYDTDDIRAAFDGSPSQGLHGLHLNPPPVWEHYTQNKSNERDLRRFASGWITVIDAPRSTMMLHPQIVGWADQKVRPLLSAIFQHTIQEKGPASALQTLLTIMNQEHYYEWLPLFDYTAPVQLASSEEHNIPAGWTGLAIVLASLAVHLLAFMSTTALYFAQTKTTILGDAWQAVFDVVERKETVGGL